MTGYFYFLPAEVSPPVKTPLLVCKQLHAQMSKMHDAAFRNYWTANTFKVELCNQSFGGSDHIEEKHLRHFHHIAFKSKRLCEFLILHFVFEENCWSFAVELIYRMYPEGRMLSLSELCDYWQISELKEVSRLPAKLEATFRANKSPLDPSIGQGFTFGELVVFLEALDDVTNSFDDVPRYCATFSI